jgi:hypothetical protein
MLQQTKNLYQSRRCIWNSAAFTCQIDSVAFWHLSDGEDFNLDLKGWNDDICQIIYAFISQFWWGLVSDKNVSLKIFSKKKIVNVYSREIWRTCKLILTSQANYNFQVIYDQIWSKYVLLFRAAGYGFSKNCLWPKIELH